MAAKKNSPDTEVTRIKASSTASKSKTKAVPAKKTTKKSVAAPAAPTKERRLNPFAAIFGYFKGAWQELRQVHWPTRKATWGLTIAVLLFSAFFVVVVLLLDAAFKYLFELVLS